MNLRAPFWRSEMRGIPTGLFSKTDAIAEQIMAVKAELAIARAQFSDAALQSVDSGDLSAAETAQARVTELKDRLNLLAIAGDVARSEACKAGIEKILGKHRALSTKKAELKSVTRLNAKMQKYAARMMVSWTQMCKHLDTVLPMLPAELTSAENGAHDRLSVTARKRTSCSSSFSGQAAAK